MQTILQLTDSHLSPRNDLFRGTTREATDIVHFPTGDRGLRPEQEAIHHDRLIDLAIGVVATDVPEDEDPAVPGLHRARIIGRARDVELVPGLARVAGPVDAAGRDVQDRSFARRQQFRLTAMWEFDRSDFVRYPGSIGFLENSLPAFGVIGASINGQQVAVIEFRYVEFLGEACDLIFGRGPQWLAPSPPLVGRNQDCRLEAIAEFPTCVFAGGERRDSQQ